MPIADRENLVLSVPSLLAINIKEIPDYLKTEKIRDTK